MGSKTENINLAGKQEPAPQKIDNKDVKVLVVDDEQFILDVVSEFLDNCGYSVMTANSGEAALEQIEKNKADIAIVDFMMDGIDGLKTIEKIAEISPSCVTILMTGFPTLDSSIKALRLGAADYILKPFKLDEVSVAIEKAIKEWRFKKEMNRLRDRVSELEASVSDKKDSIKINKKLGVVSNRSGYAPKFETPPDEEDDSEN